MDEPIKNPRWDAGVRAFEAQGAIDRARLTAAARPTRPDAYKARGLVVRLFVQREELNDANDDMEKIRTRGEAADWRNEAARMHARGKDDDARQLTAQIAPHYASEGFALMGTELDEFERLDADSQRRKRSELIEQTRAHRIAELEHLPRLEAEQSQRHAQFIDNCTEFNQLVTPLLAAARAYDFATTDAIAALLHLTQTWVNNWSFKGPVGVLEAGRYALDDLIDRLPVSDASPASSPTAATTVGASKPVPTAGSIDAATSISEGAKSPVDEAKATAPRTQIIVLWEGADHSDENVKLARVRTAMLENGFEVRRALASMKNDGHKMSQASFYRALKTLDALPELKNWRATETEPVLED